MRAPPHRLFGLLLAAASLASCTPGPTDPDGPIVRTPEPPAIASLPPRLAALGDAAVVPAPECRRCADPAACATSGGDNDVCLVQCSASGVRRWDLGGISDQRCDLSADNFCEANGLGRLTDFCWGGYS